MTVNNTPRTYIKFNITVRQGTKAMLDNYSDDCEISTYHCAYCIDNSTIYISDFCKYYLMRFDSNIKLDEYRRTLAAHARFQLQTLIEEGYRDSLAERVDCAPLITLTTVDNLHIDNHSSVAKTLQRCYNHSTL